MTDNPIFSAREVQDPRMLFRKIDSTSVTESNGGKYVHMLPDKPEPDVTRMVEHVEFGSEMVAFTEAVSELEEHATEVSVDNIPETCDSMFHLEGATYYCDTTRMGYELVFQEDPPVGAFVCVDPESLYVVPE